VEEVTVGVFRIMRVKFLACAAIFCIGFALLTSPRTSRQDVPMPLLIRFLQGPQTEAREAQFYTSPEFSTQQSWYQYMHFRSAGPRKDYWRPWSGVGDAQPTLLQSSLRETPSLDKSQGGSSYAGWRVEALAWIPFGVLFMALLDRTKSHSSIAQRREPELMLGEKVQQTRSWRLR
jgi:hypothetical protein